MNMTFSKPGQELHLDVTQEDIERGVPCSVSQCPLWFAAKRVYPAAQIVVLAGSIRILAFDQQIRYFDLPFAGSQFISQFDRFKTVKPVKLVCKESWGARFPITKEEEAAEA